MVLILTSRGETFFKVITLLSEFPKEHFERRIQITITVKFVVTNINISGYS